LWLMGVDPPRRLPGHGAEERRRCADGGAARGMGGSGGVLRSRRPRPDPRAGRLPRPPGSLPPLPSDRRPIAQGEGRGEGVGAEPPARGSHRPTGGWLLSGHPTLPHIPGRGRGAGEGGGGRKEGRVGLGFRPGTAHPFGGGVGVAQSYSGREPGNPPATRTFLLISVSAYEQFVHAVAFKMRRLDIPGVTNKSSLPGGGVGSSATLPSFRPRTPAFARCPSWLRSPTAGSRTPRWGPSLDRRGLPREPTSWVESYPPQPLD